MLITPTEHGLRLSQHGVVLSELRTSSGPTHSVFDVLAASLAVLAPAGRLGVLGFAGGGMMAPLRALGVPTVIDSVDLDRAGYDLFREHCPHWSEGVNWQQADAVAWLRQQPRDFALLLDDLSVPQDDDVFKARDQLGRGAGVDARAVASRWVWCVQSAAGGGRHLEIRFTTAVAAWWLGARAGAAGLPGRV